MASLHKQQATLHGAILFQMNDSQFQSFENNPFYKEAIGTLVAQIQAIESQKESILARAKQLKIAENDLDAQVESLEKGGTTASQYEFMPLPKEKEEISALAELLSLTKAIGRLVKEKAASIAEHFKRGEKTKQKTVNTLKEFKVELTTGTDIKTLEELADMLYQDAQSNAADFYHNHAEKMTYTPEMSPGEFEEQIVNVLKMIGHTSMRDYTILHTKRLMIPRVVPSTNIDRCVEAVASHQADSWQDRLRLDFDLTHNAKLHADLQDRVTAFENRPQKTLEAPRPSTPALSHAEQVRQMQMRPKPGIGISKEEEKEQQVKWKPKG